MRLRSLQLGLNRVALRVVNRGLFESDFLGPLPSSLRPAARLVYLPFGTLEEWQLGRRIEAFRKEIPKLKPGSLGSYELGTNTGFSGCYILTSSECEELITVEGSPELCDIADANMRRFHGSYRIMNTLFDEAFDALKEEGACDLDLCFVDGQHEREATLHYARQALPLMKSGGALLFDDIYWSDDMNQGWKELCQMPEVRTSVDLARFGVCILGPKSEPKRHFDLCDYAGRPRLTHLQW